MLVPTVSLKAVRAPSAEGPLQGPWALRQRRALQREQPGTAAWGRCSRTAELPPSAVAGAAEAPSAFPVKPRVLREEDLLRCAGSIFGFGKMDGSCFQKCSPFARAQCLPSGFKKVYTKRKNISENKAQVHLKGSGETW